MRCSGRGKLVNHLTYKDSKNAFLSKSDRKICFKKAKFFSKHAEYKALCKNVKCSVHRNESKLVKISEEKLIPPTIFQKIKYSKKCRIKEFEEPRKRQSEVNPTMIKFVEGIMEEITPEDIIFEDFLAQSFIKEAITRTVIWPLAKPKIFTGLLAAPGGVLLYGPSGVGKSTLGKYIAFKIKASFFNLPSSVFTSSNVDNYTDFIKALFLVAKARQPSVIFIDEVDTLFSQRALYSNESSRKIKNELFLCMDSAERNSDDRILIVATTKKPFDLDQDIVMKFSKRFYVSLPDKIARKKLLNKLLDCECHSLGNRDIEELVNKTDGFTTKDIKRLSQEAAMGRMWMLPAENFVNLELVAIKPISLEDFIAALGNVKPSISREELILYENWDSEFGFGIQFLRRIGFQNKWRAFRRGLKFRKEVQVFASISIFLNDSVADLFTFNKTEYILQNKAWYIISNKYVSCMYFITNEKCSSIQTLYVW